MIKLFTLLLACGLSCGTACAQSIDWQPTETTWQQPHTVTAVMSDSSAWKGKKPANPEWVYSSLCDCWNSCVNSKQPYFKSTCKQRRIDKVSGVIQKREVEIIYRNATDNSEYEKTYQLFIK